MKAAELREEIAIELQAIEATVGELFALQQDLARREPTVREKTAAAAFLAQFYSGIENILKRIGLYHRIPLPEGETWHIELFRVSAPLLIAVFLHYLTMNWHLPWRLIAVSGTSPSTVTVFNWIGTVWWRVWLM